MYGKLDTDFNFGGYSILQVANHDEDAWTRRFCILQRPVCLVPLAVLGLYRCAYHNGLYSQHRLLPPQFIRPTNRAHSTVKSFPAIARNRH